VSFFGVMKTKFLGERLLPEEPPDNLPFREAVEFPQ
jgi:hypothetical protein